MRSPFRRSATIFRAQNKPLNIFAGQPNVMKNVREEINQYWKSQLDITVSKIDKN